MSAAAELLGQLGVGEQELRRVIERLTRVTASAARLTQRLAEVADPAMTLASLNRLLDELEDRAECGSFTDSESQQLLVALGGSQAVANTLQAAGAEWPELFRFACAGVEQPIPDYAAVFSQAVTLPWEAFCLELRRLRNREYLRITLGDLTGRYDVDRAMAELTALAGGAFSAAYEWASRTLEELYGEPCAEEGHPNGGGAGDAGVPEPKQASFRRNRFVVMAMGKLGGKELNFSSDVDVAYLYDSETGTSAGGSRGQLESRAYFVRMAELVTKALQEVMAGGFVFRVDLRLRPDGINGPIANALPNALFYYESYGQTWERTALIQARPIAGSTELGEQFLRDVRPFVFRRYLDYATVADMKAMKARVEVELGEKAGRGNVKLGRGGIREIEFLVQVLQLINGGRDERVRGGGTLPTLERLVACGYLPRDQGEELAESYRFLRNVEHRIQIVHQRQTHTIPADAHEQFLLARRLGYRGGDAVERLWGEVDRHSERVRRAFEMLFHEPAADTRRAADPAVEALLRILDDRHAALEYLESLGFQRPEESYENILLLRDGPPTAPARGARRRVIYEVAPALLSSILKAADPDLALRNLVDFLATVGARTSFLALLRENLGTLRMLVDLFGASQFLANSLIRHPEQLDGLVRADLVRVHRTPEDLAAELGALLAGAEDLEGSLDAMRRFRNQEFLRIGINDMQRVLEPDEVAAELTGLAEVCLREACRVAADDVSARYDLPELSARVAVIGMGKLGGGELNYNSDLDLIFVYDDRGASAEQVPPEAFSRLAQRLIMLLQTPTREGIVYRIDTRLRPSGNKGPLVSSLEGFRDYHETRAQLWERQALIKARAVAGDEALGRHVENIIADFVYRAPLTAEEAREIRRLRQRMERELARESSERVNIKTGRGGLVDIEFVTQMLQLYHGVNDRRVRVRDTLGALTALAEVGALDEGDQALLVDGYRFLRRVENALRMAYDRPVGDLERGRRDIKALARRLGYGADVAGFWREYELRREAIRACYDRCFDRAERRLR